MVLSDGGLLWVSWSFDVAGGGGDYCIYLCHLFAPLPSLYIEVLIKLNSQAKKKSLKEE